MSATTFGEALEKIGVSLPAHLVADAEVPVLTGPQTQGDLMIVPAEDDVFDIRLVKLEPVPDNGVQVVRGEATGNTHWLHRGMESTGVMFGRVVNDALVLGVVHVPVGETAELIHTDEHGCNAMGRPVEAGDFVLRGKQEMADQIRRVAD